MRNQNLSRWAKKGLYPPYQKNFTSSNVGWATCCPPDTWGDKNCEVLIINENRVLKQSFFLNKYFLNAEPKWLGFYHPTIHRRGGQKKDFAHATKKTLHQVEVIR
ncbi:MAG: hypothetical protein DRR19_02960 [Candidatus Parabeggiatoa sp. nov. 1]|nr:MAG: hypothetical protein DRR19_02960 [Gammaproteobacteria bacterium]